MPAPKINYTPITDSHLAAGVKKLATASKAAWDTGNYALAASEYAALRAAEQVVSENLVVTQLFDGTIAIVTEESK